MGRGRALLALSWAVLGKGGGQSKTVPLLYSSAPRLLCLAPMVCWNLSGNPLYKAPLSMADYLRRGFPGAPARQPAVPGAGLWATQSAHWGPRSACYYPNAPAGKMPPGPLVCGAKSHSSLRVTAVCGWMLNFCWGFKNDGCLMLPWSWHFYECFIYSFANIIQK